MDNNKIMETIMEEYIDKVLAGLISQGYTYQNGLKEKEIMDIEKYYNISFNIDHKNYLMHYVFIGEHFYNWRDDSRENIIRIKQMLEWPLDGILFDIENNVYWPDEIKEKPNGIEKQKEIFTEYYKNNIPKLIPIFGHRYMCSEPKETGVPVYSVYQTDIIYYGYNILDYFNHEFKLNIKNNNKKWDVDNTKYWPQFCVYK
jgi:hypothetical protein